MYFDNIGGYDGIDASIFRRLVSTEEPRKIRTIRAGGLRDEKGRQYGQCLYVGVSMYVTV